MRRNLFKFALSALLVVSLSPATSYAQNGDDEQLDEPTVTFETEDLSEKISQETIDYLLEQSEGEDITIHNIIDSQETMNHSLESSGGDFIQPYALYHSYSIGSRVFTHRSPLAAQQYASVARGKTYTMTASFSTTNTVSISGGIPTGAGSTISGNFGSSSTRTISKGVTLTGPPAGYSSRQYYLTRFKDYGTFKLYEKNTLTGSTTTYNKSYSKPSSNDPFVDWSRDLK